MKILWVTSVNFPPLCQYLKIQETVMCGWVYSSVKELMTRHQDVKIGVLIGTNIKGIVNHVTLDDIDYFPVYSNSLVTYNKKLILEAQNAINKFNPDLIYLQGTESSLPLAVTIANKKHRPIIANIQGLASACYRYADGYLPFWIQINNITLMDIIRGTGMLFIKRKFKDRAKCETELIRQLPHIIGRTTWDKTHSLALNPDIEYFILNETLRDEFYTTDKWNISSCKKHSIFVSSSQEPLKGAHIVLKALPLILRKYPDAHVYFTGNNIMCNDINTILHLSGYKLYLRKFIRRNQLENNVSFLGMLPAKDMKRAFLNAHVYVMPSAIENSPNSLCEAQILGVPAIASYCGGVPDFIRDDSTGYMYRYEEYEMLAAIVDKVFSASDLDKLSENEIAVATRRHDKIANADNLYNIYCQILNHSSK